MADHDPRMRFLKGGLMHSLSCYHIAQYYVGSSRIITQNGTLARPSVYHKAYSIFQGLLVLIGYIGIDRTYLRRYRENDLHMYICTIFLIIVHYWAYICNLIHARFMNTEENIKFYLKLEYIDRVMETDKVDFLYDVVRKVSKVKVTLIFSTLGLLSFISCLDGSFGVVLTGIITTFSEVVFVSELSYCTTLVLFFSLRLRFINGIIANHLKSDIYKKGRIRQLAAKTHDFNTSDTDVYLRGLIDGFSDFQRFCRFQMFVFCVKCILGIFLYFQAGLIGVRIKMLGYLEFSTVGAFVIYSSTVIFIISVCCEIFFNDAMETKQLCTSVLSNHLDGPLRDKAARMLKTLDSCPLRLSIYDMWEMDAQLILTMFFAITMMMVTQLQFAIL